MACRDFTTGGDGGKQPGPGGGAAPRPQPPGSQGWHHRPAAAGGQRQDEQPAGVQHTVLPRVRRVGLFMIMPSYSAALFAELFAALLHLIAVHATSCVTLLLCVTRWCAGLE